VTDTVAALAAPNDLGIVKLLRCGPRTVRGSCDGLRLSQPHGSKHLRVLFVIRHVLVV
jgi:hypothetical protein